MGSPQHHSEDSGRRLGATITPVREAEDGSLEVLCAQNTVVNYLKSLPGSPRALSEFPGEFRLLGALWKPEVDVTPLDTAIRGLTSAGWRNAQRYIRSYVAEREQLGHAALQAMLFEVTEQAGGMHKTFHFLCSMSRSASDRFVEMLNQFLEAQQAYCDAKGEELYEIPESLRVQLCPMFHKVSWWRIGELLQICRQEFINDYQQKELAAHGCSARVTRNSHLEVLQRLQKLSLEEAFRCSSLREQALMAKPQQDWKALNCSELEPCIPGFECLSVLSFNLNILPFGAASWSAHSSEHSGARLREFLARVRQELQEEREARSRRCFGEFRALDVIAVQELFASPFVPGCCSQAFLVREMAAMGYHAVSGVKPTCFDLLLRGKWTDSGLVIFSRLPVVESRSIRFESGASLDAGACKGAIWARLELVAGRFLDVFNCHLQASHTGTDGEIFERIRKSQLQELKDFVELSGTEHPYILTGDFNVDAIPEPSDPMGTYGIPFRPPRQESEDYQRMVHALDPKRCLVDLLCGPTRSDPLGDEAAPSARRHPCTRPPQLRQPSTARYVARHKYPQRLDYVFYRPTLNSLVEHSHSDVECFEVRDNPAYAYLSDHFGIRAHFRLRCSFAWARKTAPKQASSSLLQRLSTGMRERFGTWLPLQVRFGLTSSWWGAGLMAGAGAVAVIASSRHYGLPSSLAHIKTGRSEKSSKHVMLCCALPLGVGALGVGALLRRCRGAQQADEAPRIERSQSMTAALTTSKFRRRIQAQSEKPARTVASSPYDSFNGSVESYRSRPCIGRRHFLQDGTLGDYSWLSYGEAQYEVLRISSGLHRKFGLKRNVRVGLLGDASAEWLLCDLALMRCGASTICLTAPAHRGVPGSPTLRRKRGEDDSPLDLELLLCSVDWLEYFVETSRCPGEVPCCPIVTFTALPARLAALAHHRGLKVWDLQFIAHLGEVAGWVPYVGVSGFDVFTTMYRSRSGTKSELAGVSVSLRGLALSADSLRQALGLRSDDRHFSYAWPAFAAERVMLHAVLAAGGAVGFFGGVRSPRIFEDIRRLQPTFLLGTPSLFRRQITRLQKKHIGLLGNVCFWLQRWALQHCNPEVSDLLELSEGQERQIRSQTWVEAVAKRLLTKPLNKWLAQPFVLARAVLVGPRTRLRFVLALCTAGSTALPPERCLWMRLLLGCPVLKGFVAVEAGGLVTLGEAPYLGEEAAKAFAVGRELPGVQMELLPLDQLKLPCESEVSILRSSEAGIELGTLKVLGIAGTPEARVGLVVGRRGHELFVFGRSVSLEASRWNKAALCEALEQLLLQVAGPWLMQLLLVARPTGVVGVAAVRLEEVWRLAKWWSIEGVSSGEDLCRDPRVIALCLRDLQWHARRLEFSDHEMPRALHLQAAPFSLEAGLQTPTFQLRRDQLKPQVSSAIEGLFDGLSSSPSPPPDLDKELPHALFFHEEA
eukprot:TRINITY_DN76177_c0_g1_i1.p1 TRINITY_DN76177_c0_g1~~TRINITY_DN76177_c0_g1_i1.p1  ORF type:complete len:1450 (-),score=292.96 TRINITY_DN76177_c0_g1_i1:121-4470(-)